MDWSGVDYLWIIVMILSAVWTLVLTASYSVLFRMYMLKGWLTVFFLGLIVFMGGQSSMCSCLFFLKTHYFSHNLPLFHTSLSLLWQTPRFISWFYEAPPSEIRDGLRLVSWLSVLWLAKPPLLHVWTSRPSPQWHVHRLNCKQWRCLYCLSIWARLRPRGY